MIRREEPWATYAAWLTAKRGLYATTVSTYITLVRRVLRNAGTPLTSEGVGAWIESLPEHHRSPHRAAYRAFAEWSAEVGHKIPPLPSLAVDVNDEALDAIDAILRSGLPAKVIGTLRWDVDDSPGKRAAFPDRVFLRVSPGVGGDYAVLPADAAETLRRWAYGDTTPGPDDLVVPRSPGSTEPLPYPVLTRLLRMGTRRVGA